MLMRYGKSVEYKSKCKETTVGSIWLDAPSITNRTQMIYSLLSLAYINRGYV